MLRSIYVDGNSTSASLYVVRSGFSRKLVIVTYITQQLNQLSHAAAADDDDDDDDDGGDDGGDYTVAGVRVYPASEGIDFARAVSSVALSADIVSVVNCLQLFDVLVLSSYFSPPPPTSTWPHL